MRSLRAAFLKKCKKCKGGGGGCASAFDKWHFEVLRRACEPDDPLLPVRISIGDHIDAERVLKEELVTEGLSDASAEAVAAAHRKQYVKAAKALSKKIKRRQGAEAPAHCSAAAADGLVTLTQGEARVQCHSKQLAKLRRLWATSGSNRDRDDDGEFLSATTRLLVRYQALAGEGFQVVVVENIGEEGPGAGRVERLRQRNSDRSTSPSPLLRFAGVRVTITQ